MLSGHGAMQGQLHPPEREHHRQECVHGCAEPGRYVPGIGRQICPAVRQADHLGGVRPAGSRKKHPCPHPFQHAVDRCATVGYHPQATCRTTPASFCRYRTRTKLIQSTGASADLHQNALNGPGRPGTKPIGRSRCHFQRTGLSPEDHGSCRRTGLPYRICRVHGTCALA